MKKIITFFQGLLIIACLCGLGGLEDYIKTSYTKEVVIFDKEGDTYKVKDNLNNKWSFTETETIYSVGDTVKLHLRNLNHTDSDLSDDKISKVERIKED